MVAPIRLQCVQHPLRVPPSAPARLVVLASTQLFFDRRLNLPGDGMQFRRLEQLGEHAYALFETPDAGLWEFRGRVEVHTYSARASILREPPRRKLFSDSRQRT